MIVQATVWLVSLLILGAIAIPLAAAVFTPLGGRGAGFALPLGLAVVTVVSLWVGQLVFGPITAVVGVLVLFGLSALAWFTGADPDWIRYRECTVVIVAAFGLSVLMRSLSPKLRVWAEGMLNFGLLKSLLRADRLPPADMWFAGEPVQYYYGGHLLAATWAELLGTPGDFLPNLAVPMVYAALMVGAYELGGELAHRRGGPRRVAGALTAVLLGLAGNMYAPFRLAAWLLPDGPAVALWESLGLAVGAFGAPYNSFDATHFAWFPTDVPIYSVLIGSAHAHVFSQPWTLVVIALSYAYFRTPRRAGSRRWLPLLLAVPIIGLIGFTNIWSAPTAVAVIGLGIVFATAHPVGLLPASIRDALPSRGPWIAELGRYVGGALAGGLALIGGTLAVAPFVLSTPTTRPLAFFPPGADWGYFVVAYGWLLAAFGLYLAPKWWGWLDGERRRLTASIVVGTALVAGGLLLGFPPLVMIAPLGVTAWALLRAEWYRRGTPGEWRDPAERSSVGVGFEALLVLAGAGLAIIVEVAYVNDGAAFGRFNTAYKTYSQIWLMWTIAAGPILAGMFYEQVVTVIDVTLDPFRRRGRLRRLVRGFDLESLRAVLAILLVISALVFGGGALLEGFTTGERGLDSATLDATAFASKFYGHYEAIQYMDSVPGQPHVVEAVPSIAVLPSFYASPISTFTGLPTVVGWWYVSDYHSEDAYEQRARDVLRIYEGDRATRSELLREYDVEYIVVGPIEREQYELGAFAEDPALTALEFGPVVIYEVDQTALPGD